MMRSGSPSSSHLKMSIDIEYTDLEESKGHKETNVILLQIALIAPRGIMVHIQYLM